MRANIKAEGFFVKIFTFFFTRILQKALVLLPETICLHVDKQKRPTCMWTSFVSH